MPEPTEEKTHPAPQDSKRNSLAQALLALLLILTFLKGGPLKAGEEGDLKSFLEYSHMIAALKESADFNPQKFLDSPYAQKSVFKILNFALGPQGKKEPETIEAAYGKAIEGALKVRDTLARSQVGIDALASLIEAHRYAIFSAQERGILWRITLSLALANRPIGEIESALGLSRAMEPLFHMGSNLFALNPEALELERLVARCRAKPAKTEEMVRVLEEYHSRYRYDPLFLYNLACGFSLLDNPKRARELLNKAMKMSPRLGGKIEKDDDLAALRKDTAWMETAKKGEVKAEIRPGTNPGFHSIEVRYRWGGLGKPVKQTVKLVWRDDRFVDGEGHLQISAELIDTLFQAVRQCHGSEAILSHITHFDDYPELYVKLTPAAGQPTTLYSSSNAPFMLPFNIYAEGKLRASNSPELGRIIHFLVNSLEIKRGEPAASYYFGGSEIPIVSGPARTDLESVFRLEAGIPENPGKGEKGEFGALPEELKNLKSHGLQKVMKTFIPGENPEQTVHVTRYVFSEKVSPTFENLLFFMKLERNGSPSWFYQSPTEYMKRAEEARQHVLEVCNASPSKVLLIPAMRGVGPLGYPDGEDLREAVQTLKKAGEGFSSLDQELVPLLVQLDFDNDEGSLMAHYLPGARKLVIQDFHGKKSLFDFSPFRNAIEWCGLPGVPPGNLQEVMFRNDMIYLEFNKTATKEELESIATKARAAGRLPEINDSDAGKKIFVKPLASDTLSIVHKLGEPLTIKLER